MAFRANKSANFKRLKKLTPSQRMDYIKRTPDYGASLLSMLTPTEFAELFPKYYQKSLPNVEGFREAISRKTTQKQDDINFGLSQGAKTVEEAERMGSWRRRGGSSGADSSGGVSSTRASGSLATNQREAYKAALAEGLSPTAARILVANLSGENLRNPNGASYADPSTSNPGQRAQGIAAWEQRRAQRIKDQFGKYPNEMSVADQTKALLWEMKTYYKPSWAALQNESMDPRDRMQIVVENFERPKYVDKSVSDRMNFYRGLGNIDTTSEATTMSRSSTRSGGFLGGGEQCVDLSKHFSGLGPASKWKFKEGAAIVPGSIIATTNYGKGEHPGGVEARNMPDKKSHYHTGVALTAPNSNGDVLILEQYAGRPAHVSMINIHNYRGSGERMAVVEGGEPTARSMQAVELGRQLANPDQLTWIQSGTSEPQAVKEGGEKAHVTPVQEAPTPAAKPVSSGEQSPAYPAEQQQIAPKTETAKMEKANKAKKTVESYKFDPEKYWNEVNTKQPAADIIYGKQRVMKETYQGFEEAQAAGAIKWNRKTNEIQIIDPNHEKIQQIYKDMQDNKIDRNAFLTKTEAGGSGTAKVSRAKRHSPARVAADNYSPEVTLSGLSKESKLIDYRGEKVSAALGVTPEQYNAYREAVASIESSGGKYGLRGGSSKRFSGAYQIGGAELKEVAKRLGEAAPVMKVKGKKTPVANEQFLNDPQMQERYFEEYNIMHHQRLMKNKKYAALSPEERLKVQGIAHNKGAGAASNYLRTGRIGTDAAGTHPQKYAHRIDKQLAGLKQTTDTEMASVKPAASTPAVASTPTTPTGAQEYSTAKVSPSKSLMDRIRTLDPYGPSASATSRDVTPKSETPRTQPVQRQQPNVGNFSIDTTPETTPPEVQRKMEPEAPKDSQQFHMQQTSTEKVQSINIDKFSERKNPEFPSPSLERHAFTIRQQQPTTGANYMHMGSDSA